ncbi:MAG: hypothetical protein KF688_18020 [Pirellulales bacterium]|nr:hypothetical protein [Pirellulales bacterium]
MNDDNRIKPQIDRLERLIEAAEASGNVGLVKALVDSHVRACREATREDVTRDRFMSRAAMLRFGQALVQRICVLLSDRLPQDQYHEIADQLVAIVTDSGQLSNTPQERRAIELRREA